MTIFLIGLGALILGIVLVEKDHRSFHEKGHLALFGLILCGIGLILILVSAQIYFYSDGVLL